MSDSKIKPYADLKYKARTYVDKDGNEKGVWLTIGTLFSSPHGSNMSLKIDTIPVGEWNGWVSIFKREDSNTNSSPTSEDSGNPALRRGLEKHQQLKTVKDTFGDNSEPLPDEPGDLQL